MTKFEGFKSRNVLTDNYTTVPNMFFDELLPQFTSMSEAKVLLVIIRNTYGMNTEINEKGETTFKETYFVTIQQLAKETGLTLTSVMTGINSLIKAGYIEKVVKSKKSIGYKLVISKVFPTQES